MNDKDDSKRTTHAVSDYYYYYIKGIRTTTHQLSTSPIKFKDEISAYTYFMGKMTRNMLIILSHLFKNGGTTERILEVMELIPQQSCSRCLKTLMELNLVNRQKSGETLEGRRFYIYKLKAESLDTFDKIERKHKEMYLKLHKIKQAPGKISSYVPTLKEVQCKSCNRIYWSEKPERCPKCKSEDLIIVTPVAKAT